MNNNAYSTHHVLVQFQNAGLYFLPERIAQVVVTAYKFGEVTNREASEMMQSLSVGTILAPALDSDLLEKERDLNGRVFYVPNPSLRDPVIHEFYHSRSQCFSHRQALSRNGKQYAMSFEETGEIFLIHERFLAAFELAKASGTRIGRYFRQVADNKSDWSLYLAEKMLRTAGHITERGHIVPDHPYHLVEVLSTRRKSTKRNHLTLVKAA